MNEYMIKKSSEDEANLIVDGIVEYNLSKVPLTQEEPFIWINRVIADKNENIIKEIPEYDYKKSGAFSYKVNENINHKHFIVLEEKKDMF